MSFLGTSLKRSRQSWRSQNAGLRLMRAFLGLTWIYAGWDKASDPGFLTQGSASFIGNQLSAYSTNSPVGSLLNPLIENSIQVGLFVMVSEFAIGIATLLWIAPASAAFGGFLMSLGLWLTSSFYVVPYFLGSDLAYAMLWLTFFLLIRPKLGKNSMSLERRGFLRVSLVAVGAGIATLVGKFFHENSKSAMVGSALENRPTKIIKSAQLKVGQRHTFTTSRGTSAILFRTSNGIFAYSTICPHQGCAVSYSQVAENLQCPCHGAVFDPLSEGKVLAGPTNTPLEKVAVSISGPWIMES